MAPGHRLRKCRKLPKIADLLDFDLFRFLTSPGGYFQARSFFFGSNGLYWSPEHTREWRRLYFDITQLSEYPTLMINYDHLCPPGATKLPSILYFLRDLAVAWMGMENLFFLLPPLRLSVCCSPKVCRAFCKAESLVFGSFFR